MRGQNVQKIFAWSGIVSLVLFFLAFLLAGFVPPPGPDLSQTDVVTFYQQHAKAVCFGMTFLMISSMFMAPYIGVISQQLNRIPNLAPALSYAQISAGTANSMFFILPAISFIITAFRPDRPPEITYMMNDVSWILALLPWPPAFMQCVVIGIAIISDDGEMPVFPRWTGYFHFLVAVGFTPALALPFVKTGPFAWNGALSFWIAGCGFIAWFVVLTTMLLRAINLESRRVIPG